MTDPTMISKIEALLAKAERTDNKHEAEAYFAKAQALMSKYAIVEAMLSLARGESHEIVSDSIPMGVDKAVISLFQHVAKANNCACFRSTAGYYDRNGKWRQRTEAMVIYGARQDIEFVKILFASLLLHCEQSLATMRELFPRDFGGKSFGYSFRLGYASSVGARLHASRQQATRDSGEPGAEVALFNRFKAAQDKMNAEHKLTTSRTVARVSDDAAYKAGYRRGQQADVSGGRNNLRGTRAIEA